MGASYIYNPLLGEFAQRFKDNRQSALGLFKKTVLGIVAVALAAAVLMLVFGRWVLALLYGSEIVEYSYLMEAAVLCTFITAFAWFMNDLLLSLRDYKASFLGNAAATIASLAITVPMVNCFGMNGVSFVGVVSYAVAVAVLSIYFASDYKKAEKAGADSN